MAAWPAALVCGGVFALAPVHGCQLHGPVPDRHHRRSPDSVLATDPRSVLEARHLVPTAVTIEHNLPGVRSRKKHVVRAWAPYILLVILVTVWSNQWTHAPSRYGHYAAERARTAQRRRPHAAGHAHTVTVRRRLRVQLAQQRRDRLLFRSGASHRPGSWAVRPRRRSNEPPPARTRAHDRSRAGAGLRHELQRRHGHARPWDGANGCAVSLLQRVSRVAGRLPDRQRHLVERAVRKPPDHQRSGVGIEPGPHGRCELHRRGALGKMVSIQSIAVATAATGMSRDDEGKLFLFTLKHSVALTVAMGPLALLFSYVFTNAVPGV